ncbi:MAG: carbohydrate kinase [Ahrensia sp.]|nr:carbohydrate kinase [Ahrensia sp.]
MFITCGEALFDVFATGPSPTKSPHGIGFNGVIGGSPLNVALGLSRMGNRAGLFTRLSTDMFGRNIRAFMDEMNVGADYCVSTDQQTTLAMILTGADGHPQYSLYTKGTADCSMEISDIPDVVDERDQVIHLGSFATALPTSGGVLRAFAKREAARRMISFDPNCRPIVIPDLAPWHAMVDEMLPIATFVKASDEDLNFMYPGQPLEAFIDRALDAGVDVVCVTRGPDGALAASADGARVDIPGKKVDVIDTVGAGDTFQAACLHFLSHQKLAKKGLARTVNLKNMVDFAIHAAAITCTRRGADLPTLDEINAFRNS